MLLFDFNTSYEIRFLTASTIKCLSLIYYTQLIRQPNNIILLCWWFFFAFPQLFISSSMKVKNLAHVHTTFWTKIYPHDVLQTFSETFRGVYKWPRSQLTQNVFTYSFLWINWLFGHSVWTYHHTSLLPRAWVCTCLCIYSTVCTRTTFWWWLWYHSNSDKICVSADTALSAKCWGHDQISFSSPAPPHRLRAIWSPNRSYFVRGEVVGAWNWPHTAPSYGEIKLFLFPPPPHEFRAWYFQMTANLTFMTMMMITFHW
jgi:hypothetical protein